MNYRRKLHKQQQEEEEKELVEEEEYIEMDRIHQEISVLKSQMREVQRTLTNRSHIAMYGAGGNNHHQLHLEGNGQMMLLRDDANGSICCGCWSTTKSFCNLLKNLILLGMFIFLAFPIFTGIYSFLFTT